MSTKSSKAPRPNAVDVPSGDDAPRPYARSGGRASGYRPLQHGTLGRREGEGPYRANPRGMHSPGRKSIHGAAAAKVQLGRVPRDSGRQPHRDLRSEAGGRAYSRRPACSDGPAATTAGIDAADAIPRPALIRA